MNPEETGTPTQPASEASASSYSQVQPATPAAIFPEERAQTIPAQDSVPLSMPTVPFSATLPSVGQTNMIPPILSTTVPPLSTHRLLLPLVTFLIFIVLAIAGWYGYRYYETHHVPPLTTQQKVLAAVREDILPGIVQVRCVDADSKEVAIGSGIYFLDASSTPSVATNAHVVRNTDGGYYGCNVYFPRPADGTFYESAYTADHAYIYDNKISKIGDTTIPGADYAILTLDGPFKNTEGTAYPFPPVKKDPYLAIQKICNGSSTINIGDKIYVIGYPGTGADSITLTDGVVSGYSGYFNEMIKVSAGVNHGNSGGIAIGADNGCIYGIPTRASQALGANIGYLLSESYLQSFLDNLTGDLTYVPVVSATSTVGEVLSQTQEFPRFSMQYPSLWEASTTVPDADGSATTTFTAPSEGALADGQEYIEVIATTEVKRSSVDAFVAKIQANLDPSDPYMKNSHYVTKQGVKVYQTGYENYMNDATFPQGEITMHAIFWYRDVAYEVVGHIDTQGQHKDAYIKLFYLMVDSLRFK